MKERGLWRGIRGRTLKGRPNCREEGEAENRLSYRVGEVHDVQRAVQAMMTPARRLSSW
jgi:hypothetical protein